MSREPLLVGIDLGTTNIKAIVFDRAGTVIAGASVPTPTVYPRPTWAHHDPTEYWLKAAQAIRQAISQLDDPRRIVSVAVTSTVLLLFTGALPPRAGTLAYFHEPSPAVVSPLP